MMVAASFHKNLKKSIAFTPLLPIPDGKKSLINMGLGRKNLYGRKIHGPAPHHNSH